MKVNTLYKHRGNTDVAFHTKVVTKTKGGFRTYGLWVNIVNPRGEYVIHDDWVFVTDTELPNWEEYDRTKSKV